MRLLNSLFLLLLVAAGPVSANSKAELISKLNQINSITAHFAQETSDQSGAIVNLSRGQLQVANGGKFNIETMEPFEQHIVSDGEDLYTYDLDLDQVVVQPLVKDPTQVPILLLGNANPEVLAAFEVHVIEQPDSNQQNVAFQLQTEDPSSVIEWINLVFEDGIPTTISLRDSLGQTTTISLDNVALNPEIEAERFIFTLPEGVDLIDDR